MSKSYNSVCRVAVDAMGGDFAPRNTVLGALNATKENRDFQLYLIGNKTEIQKVISESGNQFNEEYIIHTDQVIEMHDSPTASLKTKPDSSIVVGAKMLKDKQIDAFVSAGNTGAMMAASTLITGRVKGVSRPTIGATFPTIDGGVCNVFDVGASVDSKANHLYEYAVMGSIFVEEMQQKKNPSIGLLSVGEEDEKGNEVTKAASKLLRQSNLNFIGNVEGRDILKGGVDIIICDGFIGNILLKFAESVIGFLKGRLKNYAYRNFSNKVKVLLSKGALKGALTGMDYQEYGGVPLLGINGIAIIGHGSSSELAIQNMVVKAGEMFYKDLTKKIEESLNRNVEKQT